MASETDIRDYSQERRLFTTRVLVALGLMLVLMAVLVLRLVWLQLFQHGYFTIRADDNRMRVEIVPPVRGLIYDRNGVLLADNLPSYRLELVPEQVGDIEATLARLTRLIEIRPVDLERFRNRLKREPRFRSIPVRALLNPEEVARFELNRQNFPGVSIVATLTRHYPLGETAAHLVGYVGGITEKELEDLDPRRYRGMNYIGKTGVELSYESVLHGHPGHRVTEANAAGRLLRQIEYKPPKDGQNLYLTVYARVQQAARDALAGKEGAIVAIDPKTGGVLALVSEPSFDPSLFVEGIDHETYHRLTTDPHRPMLNRALQGTFPPGSTVKPFMALAGLEYGEIRAHDHIACRGGYSLPGSSRVFRDWKRGGHGSVDMRYSIVQSCDVYYYMLGNALKVDRIHDFLTRFSLGVKTGIDLPGEKPGLVPSSEWKKKRFKEKWYAGETLSVAIGQGYMNVTPLQLTYATAEIANRGLTPRPHVLHETRDPISGQRNPYELQLKNPIRLSNPQFWDDVIQGMVDVVHSSSGTAQRIARNNLQYRIAGKTGTAQVIGMSQSQYVKSEDLKKEHRDHAWFVAFAPVEDPKIAMTVLVEHGGHGGSDAAPLARLVMDAYLLPPPAATDNPPQTEHEQAAAETR
jgi:penicillin-binding protein 2